MRTTPYVASIDNLTPSTTISNPFPQGILPPLNDRDPNANIGAGIAAPTHDFRNPYMQSWSFGGQRELPWGLVVDVHYWGMKGTRLFETWNLNQVPDQYLSLGTRLNDLIPNPFYQSDHRGRALRNDNFASAIFAAISSIHHGAASLCSCR